MRHAALLTAMSFLLSAGVARAQAPEDEAQAELAFAAGWRLLNAGETREACAKFEAALRLSPTSGTALALGTCYEELGRTASAFGRFAEAMRLAKAENRPDRLSLAAARKEALASRLKTIAVMLAPELAQANPTVRVDGQPLDASALSLERPADPGEHLIEAVAEGYQPFRAQVVVLDEPVVVSIHMSRVPPPPPPPKPEPPAPSTPIPVVITEPARTVNVQLAEGSKGSVSFVLHTASGERGCAAAITRAAPCRLRDVKGDEAVIQLRYKGARLSRTIDLRSRISNLEVVTGDRSNGVLTTLGTLGLVGGVAAGGGALVSHVIAKEQGSNEELSGPSPRTLVTAAAISGGAGLLFTILGNVLTTPHIKVREIAGPRSVASAPRLQPIVAAGGAEKLYVGLGLTF
jgi:hypothetical protein